MLSKSDWFGLALTAIATGASFLMGGTYAGVACLALGVIALVVWHRKQDDSSPSRKSFEDELLDRSMADKEALTLLLTSPPTAQTEAGALLDRLMGAKPPELDASLEDDGRHVFLVVTGAVQAAEYWVRLSNQQGFLQWPVTEDVFGYWKQTTAIRAELAVGETGRCLLAWRDMNLGICWVALFVGGQSMEWQERRSRFATLLGSNPPTDQWKASLTVEIFSKPSLGKWRRTLDFKGNGEVVEHGETN